LTAPNRFRIIRRPILTTERPMSLRKIAFALLALFSLPAVSLAGLISFNYTATGTAIAPPGGLPYSPGDITFSLTSEGHVPLTEPLASFELGSVQLGLSPGPLASDTYFTHRDITVSVTVTDFVNGGSAVLELHAAAIDDWIYRSWDGQWFHVSQRIEFGPWDQGNRDSTSVSIADTRYELSVRPENDNTVGVYTLSAYPTTPEPGTFVLAALGLAPLGARFLRRRVKVGGAQHTPA
jgi:hypothetical protein